MSTFQLGSPMWRLTERIVWWELLAAAPTSPSPFLANATTLGVVREPSEFAMTSGSPPERTETTELVVPRSIPTARDIEVTPFDVFLIATMVTPWIWLLSKELSRGRSSSEIECDLGHPA